MWDVVIFDLDGTLTDPKEGITRSVAYALSHMGICVDEPDSLVNFIGPPLVENFRACYGMSQEQALEALAAYRSRFSSVGWAENLP